MKRYFFPGFSLLIVAGLALAQQLAEKSTVINIEVPVRVYKANRFVDNLTIDDFDIYEDGKLQKLEAVYLVRKRAIERRDELTRFSPQTNRSFFLFFEISEYSDKLSEAVDFFVQNVIMPGDSLTIVTPMKTYRLKPKSFEALTREKITEQLKSKLRADTLTGSAEYRSTITELETLAKALSDKMSDYQDTSSATLGDAATSLTYKDTSFDEILNHYATTLSRLDSLRTMDQVKIMEFSTILKKEPGQKYVYLFYQREFIPKIESRILNAYIERFQERPDLNQTIQEIFDLYRRDVLINVDLIKQSYADSSIAIHFLFIAGPPPRRVPGVEYREQSEDIFSTFQEMARATGGYSEVSQNPAYLMKNAVEASENYYLLYYTPRPYPKDGKFHRLVVRVKDRDCRVSHRLGYYGH